MRWIENQNKSDGTKLDGEEIKVNMGDMIDEIIDESLKEKVILKSGQTPFSKMGKNPFIYFLIIIFFVSTILKFRNNVFDN